MTRKVDVGEPPVPISEPPQQGMPHRASLTATMALIVGASSGPGQFPPQMARKPGGRVLAGLLIRAAACPVLIVVFNPAAVASIGSTPVLLICMLVTAAHCRVRAGARPDRAADRS